MKTECESNTMSRHVMCPNTYICIKQDWLCGELDLFSVVQAFERLSLQTATMTATTSPTKLTAERRPIAPTTNSNASTVFACHRSGCAVREKLLQSPMNRLIDLALFRRRQRLQRQLRRGQLHPIVSRICRFYPLSTRGLRRSSSTKRKKKLFLQNHPVEWASEAVQLGRRDGIMTFSFITLCRGRGSRGERKKFSSADYFATTQN